MAEKIILLSSNTSAAAPRGRPKRPAKDVRSNRVVTFLTGSELQGLEQIAIDEDRSLSSVVHRIVSLYLRDVHR
jgi:hypothetical protein